MGKQPPQSSSRPGCIDDSAPICDSHCCVIPVSRPAQSNDIQSHKSVADATSKPKPEAEEEEEIKDLLLIGAGPHGHAIMLRLLEPDPDFLSDKERHIRGESTDRLRPIHDVTKHIKNLSRGQRATLRSKSRKSKKNHQVCTVSPNPPPHLKLNEVKKSVLVVDAHGGWMQAWKDNFESLRIPKLRSLMNAHTDPYDHRSLEYYAEAKGRGNELVTLTSLSQRDNHFRGPYQVPSTSIFNSFHDLLSKAYGIDGLINTGKVLSIHPTQGHDKVDEPVFEVQIAFGNQKSHVRTVKTKRIVCAMGPIFRASEPQWLLDLAPEACERVLHAHQICPYLKRRNEGESGTDDVMGKILIVGGGLTSAQLALLAVESHWCTGAKLIQRSKMNPRHFDIGNEWMGPKRGKLLEEFWCLDVNERVKKLKETRGGGTIPPEVISELQNQGKNKKLEVKEEVEVTKVQWVDGRLKVFLDDGSVPDFYDMIWLATGAQNHIDYYSALTHLRSVLPVDVVNGLPVLAKDLSWRAPTVTEGEDEGIDEPIWKQIARKRIWISGALAALQLGPDALNLVGARHGSCKVAQAIREDIAQSKAAANQEEDEGDCSCVHC